MVFRSGERGGQSTTGTMSRNSWGDTKPDIIYILNRKTIWQDFQLVCVCVCVKRAFSKKKRRFALGHYYYMIYRFLCSANYSTREEQEWPVLNLHQEVDHLSKTTNLVPAFSSQALSI